MEEKQLTDKEIFNVWIERNRRRKERKHLGIEEMTIDFAKYYHKKRLALLDVSYWVEFDWDKPETRPTKYGKYFVHRKDGKVHWETWNGSGWAYNGNVITYWMEVKPPCS